MILTARGRRAGERWGGRVRRREEQKSGCLFISVADHIMRLSLQSFLKFPMGTSHAPTNLLLSCMYLSHMHWCLSTADSTPIFTRPLIMLLIRRIYYINSVSQPLQLCLESIHPSPNPPTYLGPCVPVLVQGPSLPTYLPNTYPDST